MSFFEDGMIFIFEEDEHLLKREEENEEEIKLMFNLNIYDDCQINAVKLRKERARQMARIGYNDQFVGLPPKKKKITPNLVFNNYHLEMDKKINQFKYWYADHNKKIERMKGHYLKMMSIEEYEMKQEVERFMHYTSVFEDFMSIRKPTPKWKNEFMRSNDNAVEIRERGFTYRPTEKSGDIIETFKRNLEKSEAIVFIQKKIEEEPLENRWKKVLEVKELENKYLVLLEHRNELEDRIINTGHRYFEYLVELINEINDPAVFHPDTEIGKSLKYFGLDYDRSKKTVNWMSLSKEELCFHINQMMFLQKNGIINIVQNTDENSRGTHLEVEELENNSQSPASLKQSEFLFLFKVFHEMKNLPMPHPNSEDGVYFKNLMLAYETVVNKVCWTDFSPEIQAMCCRKSTMLQVDKVPLPMQMWGGTVEFPAN